ncbi:hypothetical protein [Nostoc punctiforme]|uniref:hypothetical protein n=1 Tax=Nostoc punctiforme TaxID=272131 RepID=UPI0030ED2BB2
MDVYNTEQSLRVSQYLDLVLIVDLQKPARVSQKLNGIAIYTSSYRMLKIQELLTGRGYGMQFNLEFKIGNKPI